MLVALRLRGKLDLFLVGNKLQPALVRFQIRFAIRPQALPLSLFPSQHRFYFFIRKRLSVDEKQCFKRRTVFVASSRSFFLHHYIRKIIHLLKEDKLFARKMKDRKENHDHLRARFFAGQALEMHIPFFLDAAEHLRDLFLQRDDLFFDRFRLKRIGLDGLKDLVERAPEARNIRFFPG